MEFKTIDDFDFFGKRVILRVDLNSEIRNGKVEINDRIIEHSKTIKELQKKGAKIIVIAHQGRPGEYDFISLKKHSLILNKLVKIKFVKDIIGEKAIKEIGNLKNGEAILLENIRFLKEEFKPSKNNKIIRILSPLADIFINDALSISHRNQTSITGFPEVMPSCIGRVMEKELRNIDKITLKDSLYILGGSKIEDNMLLIEKNKILSTGVFCLLTLIASGKNLGLENKRLAKYKKYISKIKQNLNHIKNPIDLAFDLNGKRKEIDLFDLPVNLRAFDIGRKSVELFKREINGAKSIFWKGTAGFAQNKEFEYGTRELLKIIEKSGVFCLVAGGHSSSAIKRFGIDKNKIGYVSLSGGALIHYIAGKKLPGLEVLKRK